MKISLSWKAENAGWMREPGPQGPAILRGGLRLPLQMAEQSFCHPLVKDDSYIQQALC